MPDIVWVGTDSGNEGDWATNANWSSGAVPIGSDDVYFEDSSQSVTSGLDQSGVELDSLNIGQSYTGSIGTDSTALQIESPIVEIGYHNGPGSPAGSPLLNLDFGSVDAVISVHNTGTSADTSQAPVRIVGAGSSGNTMNMFKGSVELATGPGDEASFTLINVSYKTRAASDADLFIGKGVSLFDLNMTGGDVFMECGANAVVVHDGVLTISGNDTVGGAINSIDALGGTVYANSIATISTLQMYGGGSPTVDFTQNTPSTPRTVSVVKLDPGGTLKWNKAFTTFTANPTPYTTNKDVTYTAS